MSLVSLERALEQLAREFAMHVVADVVRARISDVSATLRDDAVLEPHSLRIDPVRDRASPRPLPVRAASPRSASPAGGRGGRRVSHAKRERARGAAATVPPDVMDEPEPSDIITDPALLLDVIASARRSSPPPPPSRRGSRAPGVLEARDEGSGDAGPVLRPGERLQRTAGGSVVLRRGRP